MSDVGVKLPLTVKSENYLCSSFKDESSQSHVRNGQNLPVIIVIKVFQERGSMPVTNHFWDRNSEEKSGFQRQKFSTQF
jgi:hypothetical protein